MNTHQKKKSKLLRRKKIKSEKNGGSWNRFLETDY